MLSIGVVLSWKHHDRDDAIRQLDGKHEVLIGCGSAEQATELVRRGMIWESSYFYTFASEVGEVDYWEKWLDGNNIPMKQRGWLTK